MSHVIYEIPPDLQGRKIKGQSVKKGVYVVNGRKVVIK